MDWIYWVIAALVAVLCLLVGYFARQLMANQQIRMAQNEAKKLLESAQVKYEQMVLDAKDEAVKVRAAAEADSRERRYELQRLERRSSQREERLERKMEALERREKSLVGREKEIEDIRAQVEEVKEKQLERLEAISGMSSDQAKQELLHAVEDEIKEDASRRVREWETRFKDEIDNKARDILATTIQRCATDVVSRRLYRLSRSRMTI
jgi:ribonucrease Y